MKTLGFATKQPTRVYLVGGASAVLLSWRESTIDVNLKVVPNNDRVLRMLSEIKEQLSINIELAAPDNFIPALPGWQGRSQFIVKQGSVEFFHYDFYAQALSKLERGHSGDHSDVRAMIETKLISLERLLQLFSDIEPQLYRYRAIDQPTFRRAVEKVATEATSTTDS